jgi:hypothetical protein
MTTELCAEISETYAENYMHKLYAELEIVSDRTQKNEDNYQ